MLGVNQDCAWLQVFSHIPMCFYNKKANETLEEEKMRSEESKGQEV